MGETRSMGRFARGPRSRMLGRSSVAWLLVLLAVGLAACAYYAVVRLRAVGESFDDGPFAGVAAQAPGPPPTSRVTRGKLVIECYNRSGEQPVVAAKWSDGRIAGAWEINTQREGERVEECRLTAMHRTRDGYEVRGWALWTYGHESIRLYFDPGGKLVSFYLSW